MTLSSLTRLPSISKPDSLFGDDRSETGDSNLFGESTPRSTAGITAFHDPTATPGRISFDSPHSPSTGTMTLLHNVSQPPVPVTRARSMSNISTGSLSSVRSEPAKPLLTIAPKPKAPKSLPSPITLPNPTKPLSSTLAARKELEPKPSPSPKRTTSPGRDEEKANSHVSPSNGVYGTNVELGRVKPFDQPSAHQTWAHEARRQAKRPYNNYRNDGGKDGKGDWIKERPDSTEQDKMKVKAPTSYLGGPAMVASRPDIVPSKPTFSNNRPAVDPYGGAYYQPPAKTDDLPSKPVYAGGSNLTLTDGSTVTTAPTHRMLAAVEPGPSPYPVPVGLLVLVFLFLFYFVIRRLRSRAPKETRGRVIRKQGPCCLRRLPVKTTPLRHVVVMKAIQRTQMQKMEDVTILQSYNL